MEHNLEKLLVSDGSWDAFEADWRSQCETFGEDFDQYAVGSLPVLRSVASEDRPDLGVFVLRADEGGFAAVAQANSTLLPGYEGKVLRVRHMLLSPTLDFGELPIEHYAQIMSRMFSLTVALSMRTMPSEHVKFHMRSPGDRQFFSVVLTALKDLEIFTTVAMRGSWLYLTFKRPPTAAPVENAK